MEFLILGEETGGVFSAERKGYADHQHEGDEGQEKYNLSEDEGAPWGVDDNDVPTGPFLLSTSGGGAELDLLPGTCNTDIGSLLGVCAEAKCRPSTAVPRPIAGASSWAQEARAAYPLKPTWEAETGLVAHLDAQSDTDMAYDGNNDTGAVTHVPESKFVMEEAEEDDIAAADWLDVSHALLVDAEQAASGKSRQR
ncbi:unnamed protein product [Ectocarpus sp. 12 AP-2014]